MIKRIDSRGMRQRRHKRVRMNLAGTTERPRISVFRSTVHIYAQIIDDVTGRTLVQASSLDEGVADVKPVLPAPVAAAAPEKGEAATEKPAKGGKPAADKGAKPAKPEAKPAAPAKTSKRMLLAQQVGTVLAQRAQDKGIKRVVFDRGGYPYHGRIKALAESARAAGLEF